MVEGLTERSVGLWPLREPPKVPNGVLLAATTKTPRERALLATISEKKERVWLFSSLDTFDTGLHITCNNPTCLDLSGFVTGSVIWQTGGF